MATIAETTHSVNNRKVAIDTGWRRPGRPGRVQEVRSPRIASGVTSVMSTVTGSDARAERLPPRLLPRKPSPAAPEVVVNGEVRIPPGIVDLASLFSAAGRTRLTPTRGRIDYIDGVIWVGP